MDDEDGGERSGQVWRNVEYLSPGECLRLLGRARVGRLGVSIAALPVVLPVNFVVSDDNIVIRTIAGTKLDASTAGAVLAFEVDHYAEDGTAGWSVMVQGASREITDPIELARARSLPLESWAFDGRADHFIKIEIATISGRRFGFAGSDTG